MANPLTQILNGGDQNDRYKTLTNQQVRELDALSAIPQKDYTLTDKKNLDYAFTDHGYMKPGYRESQGTGATDPYEQFKDPKTGKVMTPQEYAVYLGNKVPGSVTKYAGDAMLNPNQTSEQLTTTATNLNNARNDIATGTTDPYKVGNKSGIAYSPAQLKAIESAYAGIYDPVLNDVFARLKTKQAEDQQAQDRADIIFKTNEAIRQWKATIGTNRGSSATVAPLGLLRGEDGYVNWEQYKQKAAEAEKNGQSMKEFIKNYPPTNYINPADKGKLPSYLQSSDANPYGFTDNQLNKAAIAAGMDIADFRKLSDDAKNWYINPIKTEKSHVREDSNGDPVMITMREAFEEDFEAVKNGKYSGEELENRILSGNLPDDLKVILIAQIPEQDPDTIKEPIFDKVIRIMNKITGGIDTSNNGPTATIGGKSIFDIK